MAKPTTPVCLTRGEMDENILWALKKGGGDALLPEEEAGLRGEDPAPFRPGERYGYPVRYNLIRMALCGELIFSDPVTVRLGR